MRPRVATIDAAHYGLRELTSTKPWRRAVLPIITSYAAIGVPRLASLSTGEAGLRCADAPIPRFYVLAYLLSDVLSEFDAAHLMSKSRGES